MTLKLKVAVDGVRLGERVDTSGALVSSEHVMLRIKRDSDGRILVVSAYPEGS